MITLKEALALTVINENEPIHIRIDHKYGEKWEHLMPKEIREKFSVKKTMVKYIRPYPYCEEDEDGNFIRPTGMMFVIENKEIWSID